MRSTVLGVLVSISLLLILGASDGRASDGAGGAAFSARPCDPPAGFWVRGEYLLWFTRGIGSPPLVTTGPAPAGGVTPLGRTDTVFYSPDSGVGVLGQPETEVLFGHDPAYDEVRWGGRLTIGRWLDPCQRFGVEGEYLALGGRPFDPIGEPEMSAWASDGAAILARPFFNVLTDQEDAALVAFAYPYPDPPPDPPPVPDVVAGVVSTRVSSTFRSAGARLRLNRWRDGSCGRYLPVPNHACPESARFDLVAGYRYLWLHEDLGIRHASIWSGEAPAPGVEAIDTSDLFDTRNQFHGGEIGLLFEYESTEWWLEFLGKVALGNSRQIVRIDGDTTIFTGPVPASYSGGLLAQRTNMGTFRRNEFAIVPEIRITLGVQLSERMKATIGYSWIYWSRVVRPGDQVDSALNPNLFPPEADPFSGSLRPALAFDSTDYWAHGVGFGVDYCW